MKLTLIPQHGADGDAEVQIIVAGTTLVIDGSACDLTDTPREPVLSVTLDDGGLHVTLIARLGPDAALDPGGPWVLDVADGPVEIPALRRAPEQGEGGQ
jgi:hypothetical protein